MLLPETSLLGTTTLTSLGEDAETLLAFKYHAGLTTDEEWTEANFNLKTYLLSAEHYVTEQSGSPYRLMEFTEKRRRLSYDPCSKLYFLPLSRSPASDSAITFLGNPDSLSYTEGTDYELLAEPTPRVIFFSTFTVPDKSLRAYPWEITYSAGGQLNPMQLVAIFQLAAYYYRFPEAVGKPVPDSVLASHLDVLSNNFL